MRVRRPVILIFLMVLVPGLAAAQQVNMRVLNNGKPQPDVRVTSLLNASKPGPVGTTNADGDITIPSDMLVPKGTRVAVWVRRCEDGTVAEVILAPADDRNACMEQDAKAGDDCDCDETPVIFVFGDGGITVDTATGTVTQDGGIPRIGDTFMIGVKFNGLRMLNLEEVAGEAEGATGSEGTTWAPGVALFFEVAPWGPVALGVAGTYAKMETTTQFDGDEQTSDIKYYSLGPYARLDIGRGFRMGMHIVPFVEGGLTHVWNKADFETDGESDHRVHRTWAGEVGGGFYHFSTPGWGLIFQALYSTSGDGDADEHIRVGGGIVWKPFIPRYAE